MTKPTLKAGKVTCLTLIPTVYLIAGITASMLGLKLLGSSFFDPELDELPDIKPDIDESDAERLVRYFVSAGDAAAMPPTPR